MDTPNLIERLVGEFKPVRRLPSMSLLYIWWILSAGVAVAIAIGVIGFRLDLADKSGNGLFIWESLTLGIFALWSAYDALRLSVPGADERPLRLCAPFIAAGVWLTIVGYRLYADFTLTQNSALAADADFMCALIIIAISVLPNFMLVRIIKRAYPLKFSAVGILVGTSNAALAAAGMQFICARDRAVHIFTWHLLPIVLSAVIGAAVSFRLFYDGSTANNQSK